MYMLNYHILKLKGMFLFPLPFIPIPVISCPSFPDLDHGFVSRHASLCLSFFLVAGLVGGYVDIVVNAPHLHVASSMSGIGQVAGT